MDRKLKALEDKFDEQTENTLNNIDKQTSGSTLKELYTSISTLAQKLVLTFFNNKFILKILAPWCIG